MPSKQETFDIVVAHARKRSLTYTPPVEKE